MSKILIPTPLRKFTANTSSVEVGGETVGQSISQLVEKFPDLKKHLLDEQGNIRNFIRIYVGDEDIQSLNGADTALETGTVLSIIPAIAGGSW
jgi:molybdopterin synthase sulfur carrier subunit